MARRVKRRRAIFYTSVALGATKYSRHMAGLACWECVRRCQPCGTGGWRRPSAGDSAKAAPAAHPSHLWRCGICAGGVAHSIRLSWDIISRRRWQQLAATVPSSSSASSHRFGMGEFRVLTLPRQELTRASPPAPHCVINALLHSSSHWHRLPPSACACLVGLPHGFSWNSTRPAFPRHAASGVYRL